jgi:uncharacterized membrane-anchored protein YhcB (DUF1043 family)
VGNEENGYPVPDPKKTMISVTNEHSYTHKKILMEEITEKLMEEILIMVNKLQDAFKKYQDSMNKKLQKAQKQLKELREDFDKHQSETKETIKKRHMK